MEFPNARSLTELRQMQRLMASVLLRPLAPNWGMQKRWTQGERMSRVVEGFIKPNAQLTAFERLEIYNRQYWFRVLDCLHDDYPGMKAILGEQRFTKLCRAYLEKYPSTSYTLRNLGNRLETFLQGEPVWCGTRHAECIAMIRFEWAQIVAFDGPSKPCISVDALMDESPTRLRLDLQPYITLLDLEFAVDEYSSAARKLEGNVLRSEASNAVEQKTQLAKPRSRLSPPRRKRVLLAVHRFDNQLYYKRLEPAAFELLSSIQKGNILADACASALPPEPTQDDLQKLQHWFRDWAALGWFCRRFIASKSSE